MATKKTNNEDVDMPSGITVIPSAMSHMYEAGEWSTEMNRATTLRN